MPTKVTLPAISTPHGVPESLSSVVAHYQGYPIIADDNGVPIAAISHYLRIKISSKNTRLAYRDDIFAFISAIARRGLEWDSPALSTSDFVAYRNMLINAQSRLTGRTREIATVQRRLIGLRQFYTWAHEKEYVRAKIDCKHITSLPDHLVKAAAEKDQKENLSGGDNQEKKYISPDHMSNILDAMGSRTNKNWSLDCFFNASMRNRLMAEFSLHTGARVDEVSHLMVQQVPVMSDFNPEEYIDERFFVRMNKRGSYPIRLSWTKRLEPRTVRVPADLVWWLNWYVQIERRKVLEKALRRLGRKEFERRVLNKTPWLWLNGMSEDCPDSSLGSPMSEKMLGRKFTEAVKECNLIKTYYSSKGEVIADNKPVYSFHDLRHTFAIWHYLLKYRQVRGQPDAEMVALTYVKTLLGHKRVETTRNHYVKLARFIEMNSDHIYAYQNLILRPNQ